MRSIARRSYGRSDATAARRDLAIGGATGALLEFIGANAGEDGMRVRIDKTRHHNATSGFDDFTITANQFFDFAPPADGFDVFTAHEERAIFEDCELPQIAARARMPRASEGHHLRAIYDCESFSHQS